MKRTLISLILALAGPLWVAACGDGDGGGGPISPPGPVAGTLTVNLTTPNADDRAIHISITGTGAADSVKNVLPAAAGYTLHSRVENGRQGKAAVFGNLTSGALVRFDVPDVNRASSYSTILIDVADGTNAVRSNKTAYVLQIQN